MRASGSLRDGSSFALACLVTLLLAVISLLPGTWKSALHTRGSLHSWAHFYAFGGLCALYLRLARNQMERHAFAAVAMLLALGLEFAQAHAQFGHIEGQDLAWDLLGAGVSVAAQRLKPLLNRQDALLAQPMAEASEPAASW